MSAFEESKVLWADKRYFQSVLHILNCLPQIFFILGERRYLEIVEANQGRWSFTGPMGLLAWWRELFHFMGGVLLTLPFIGSPFACVIAAATISLLALVRELLTDAENGVNLKNIIDWIAWSLGAMTVAIISGVVCGN